MTSYLLSVPCLAVTVKLSICPLMPYTSPEPNAVTYVPFICYDVILTERSLLGCDGKALHLSAHALHQSGTERCDVCTIYL